MSLFEQIGEEVVADVISRFYDQAFLDPLIGHFFFRIDKEQLITKQIEFSISLLGGPRSFLDKNLKRVHGALQIRSAHFLRRQMLFKEILQKSSLTVNQQRQWLALENRLKPLIVNSHGTCHD